MNEREIYRMLADHQQAETWEHRELVQELQRWATIFDFEFKLEITEVALSVDWSRYRSLGHFRPGHNGLGLRGEVAINQRQLPSREPGQILGTLLHELLHAGQQVHGTPGKGNYHNKQFRDKAGQYGLIVEPNGVTHYAPQSPFTELLRKHGVHIPELPGPTLQERGTSKLKKWSCGCTNVRVAVADFRAKCLRCGNNFEMVV
ncbi:MAG: hypothetical protein HY000_23680 [Planctomycetes bacterium]|nr:hypothetical protein [Planctomycetota bacterium]